MGRLRALLVDLTPLRESRDFRMLWASQVGSLIGRQVVIVAMPYQVYVVTRSSLAVGLLSMAQAVAIVAASLSGGGLIDRFDRRRVQLAAKSVGALMSLGLALGSVSAAEPVWLIFVLGALGSGAMSLDQAASSATVPRLVSRRLLPAALSLRQVLFQGSAIVGPALGGVAIASLGLPAAYGLDVLGFLPSAVLVARLAPQPPSSAQVARGWQALLEGLSYVRRSRILLAIFIADLNAMIFGMPTAVFPALALSVLRIGPGGLGLLYSAPAVGALAGSLLSGWVTRVERQGAVIIGAITVWGLAIAGFGLSGRLLWVALALLALAGAADLISAVFRGTILQLTVPDAMRGRMSSFNLMVVTTGPRLGDLEAGVVAALFSPVVSVVSGGLLCSLGIVVLALLSPTLRGYRASGPERQPTPSSSTENTNVAPGGIGPTPRSP
ncbi:MAG: MFS transporter [Chloroflexi bacterium]|nr:MAG: MFS transporter [Chloroflexota bacterium]